MRAMLFVVASGAAVCLSSCAMSDDSGDSVGTTPTGSSPQVVSIQVNGLAKLYIEQVVDYTATARLSNGSGRQVTGGTWGTDAPSVVSIDNTGRLTALAPGLATIWVDADGVRGTLLLTVKGRLVGDWVLISSNQRVVEPDATFKVFTETTFAFTHTDPATGSVLRGHNGTYTLEGDQLTEYVESASTPTLVGQTFTFTVVFDGDTYRQTGICCGTGTGGGRGGGGGSSQVLDEVWMRVTPW
jgi:hypothetical protein